MKKIMIAGLYAPNDTYENYVYALEQLGAEGFISLEPERIAEADGLLLPGSEQDINPKLWGEKDICTNDVNDDLDNVQWRLLELAEEQNKAVLGVCRGMQFMNVFCGGSLIQDLPFAEEHKMTTPDKYHNLYHREGFFMYNLFGAESEVNTLHHQGVGRIGTGFEAVSVWNDGEDSVVEAIWNEDRKMLGVQWHPERMVRFGNETQQEDGRKLIKYFLDM